MRVLVCGGEKEGGINPKERRVSRMLSTTCTTAESLERPRISSPEHKKNWRSLGKRKVGKYEERGDPPQRSFKGTVGEKRVVREKS